MKRRVHLYLFILFVCMLFVGCYEDTEEDVVIDKAISEAVDEEIIQDRNGLIYIPNTEKPYTGWVQGYHYDSVQLAIRYHVKNGERDGLCTWWHDNGQKRSERTYKAGLLEGLWTTWYKNGQKSSEGTYKAGKREGLWTTWYKNGQKGGEDIYHSNRWVGLRAYWD